MNIENRSLLVALDHRFGSWLIKAVPPGIEGHHLTCMTIVWSGMACGAGVLVASDVRWIHLLSFAVVAQYMTDAIDGKLGARRGRGLVKWGYHMDHFLDYVFLCSVLLAYDLALPPEWHLWMAVAIAVAGGFMVNSFLAQSGTGILTLSYCRIGPFESRLLFVALNTFVALDGRTYLLHVVPYAVIGSVGVLVVCVYRTQRALWRVDQSVKTSVTDEPHGGVTMSPEVPGRR